MTKIQSQQAQATVAINGSKATAKAAPAPANADPAVKSTKLAVAAKWSTVTVTATTPPFSPNRATPADIAYDVARIHGHAVLKIDGKPDREYVRCLDGVVRSAKFDAGKAALKAHAKA